MPPQKDEGSAQKQVGIYFHPPTYLPHEPMWPYLHEPTNLSPIEPYSFHNELNLLTPK
jgi:hypothetical protein